MKTSIRNRLTAMILAVCLSIILIIWLTITLFFKPMYYSATQTELAGMLTKTVKTIRNNDGLLTPEVVSEIQSYMKSGVCIEISDEFGTGLVLMEGIGDACQLHGAKDDHSSSLYLDQRRLNTQRAQKLRSDVRTHGNFSGNLTDEYNNRQIVRGSFVDNRFTVIVSTSLARTDSIVNIVPKQFAEITRYDMSVYFRDTLTEKDRQEFGNVVAEADDFMFYHQSSVDLSFAGQAKELYMISGSQQLTRFIDLHKGNDPLDLPGLDEVVLSVGVCENLGIHIGDRISLRNAQLQTMELTVSAIYDNYVDNCALVHPQTIETHWGSAPEEQMAFVRIAPGQNAHALGAAITDLDTVLNVSVSQDLADMISGMMDALDLVIVLIVVSAGLLAVTVLYNLTNINIKERIREIATIKVLGFQASETGAYVFKENMILTVAGSLLGLGLGWLLLLFVINQVKVDMIWFQANIEPVSYVLSVLLTLVSALAVDFVFYFKLDEINMAEALKSVE